MVLNNSKGMEAIKILALIVIIFIVFLLMAFFFYMGAIVKL